jgi:hypothetical protein
MSKKLAVEEITVGKYITILDPITRAGREDFSYMGDVLEVLAVDLPYILVKALSGSTSRYTDSKQKLDTRYTTFMALSKEFVEASTAQPPVASSSVEIKLSPKTKKTMKFPDIKGWFQKKWKAICDKVNSIKANYAKAKEAKKLHYYMGENPDNPYSDRSSFGPITGLTWIGGRGGKMVGVDATGKEMTKEELARVYPDSLIPKACK